MSILPKKTVQEINDYPASFEGRQSFIRLDVGENTVGFPEFCPDGLAAQLVASYPEYAQLASCAAKLWNVSPQQILFTDGSDYGLQLIPDTFIEPGVDHAVISSPSFVVISRSLKIAGATIHAVNVLDDLSFDTAGISKALEINPKLAMFATPDNPTGAMLPRDQIIEWCKRHTQTLFVIDEAYFEYSNVTVLPEVHTLENLLVTRTFSKAWALAGLRLGAIIGNEQLIRYLDRVRLPFNVNSLAVDLTTKMISHADIVLANAKETVQRKRSVIEKLRESNLKVIDGHANFFLLDMGEQVEPFTKHLADAGILVRNCSIGVPSDGHPLFGKVRISIGSPAELDSLLQAITAYLSKPATR